MLAVEMVSQSGTPPTTRYGGGSSKKQQHARCQLGAALTWEQRREEQDLLVPSKSEQIKSSPLSLLGVEKCRL